MHVKEFCNKLICKFRENWLWPMGYVLRNYLSPFLDDSTYIKLDYFTGLHRFPNLKNPQTYNEKLQWLKLNNQHDEYSKYVDKYEAKEWAKSVLGEKMIIPSLGIWDSPDEIPFDSLPDQFVLKVTHDSGGVIVCKDKKTLDIDKVKKQLRQLMAHDYFFEHREYPYKNLKPRILAEKYMVDESGTELKDYKFFCFNGQCKMLFVATDRNIGDTRFDFFDENFHHLPFRQGHPWARKPISEPKGFAQMKEVAEKLSKGFPHVRVDLYDINGDIYFGEMTFFHFSGFVPFVPSKWDYTIGTWLNLPAAKNQ